MQATPQVSAAVQHMEPTLNALEAERIVDDLKPFGVKEIGSKQWMKQHENMEKLNAQAQYSIMTQSDEFVVEGLIDHEKVDVLIHELLALEVWKEKVFPEIIEELAATHGVKAYFILYHEALLVGLLEKAMFHARACSGGGDMLMELADYCYRRLVFLATIDPDELQDGVASKEDLDISAAETLSRQKKTIDFGVSITCLTLVRFLTEHSSSVPLTVLTRLLDEQDILFVLVPLLETPPWRRKNKGKIEKFSEGRWQVVAPGDVARLSKTEAQVWLALCNLLCDPTCRSKYKWDERKKANVARISKFVNEVLVDQLPVLVDLRRTLDQLQIMDPPDVSSSSFIIQQVPQVREGLLKSAGDWKAVAREVISSPSFVASEEEKRQELERLCAVYSSNNFEQFMDDPKCAACGKMAQKRCSRCKTEWYCGRECQVKSWKTHKPLCDLMMSAQAPAQ